MKIKEGDVFYYDRIKPLGNFENGIAICSGEYCFDKNFIDALLYDDGLKTYGGKALLRLISDKRLFNIRLLERAK